MKRFLFFCLTGLFCWACNPPKESVKPVAKAPVVQHDSTEYEVFISDPGFDMWYKAHFSPGLDRTYEYYNLMNRTAILNWNNYYNSGRHGTVVENYIDFVPTTNYGMEVNRKLFWYFKYVEGTYKIRLFK